MGVVGNAEAGSERPPGTTRVRLTLEFDIAVSTLADIAREALETGADLQVLLATRYLANQLPPPPRKVSPKKAEDVEQKGRRKRSRKAAPAKRPRPFEVRDFPHLFDRAPEGRRPYRGSGRPPQWLLDLIEQEISQREEEASSLETQDPFSDT